MAKPNCERPTNCIEDVCPLDVFNKIFLGYEQVDRWLCTKTMREQDLAYRNICEWLTGQSVRWRIDFASRLTRRSSYQAVTLNWSFRRTSNPPQVGCVVATPTTNGKYQLERSSTLYRFNATNYNPKMATN